MSCTEIQDVIDAYVDGELDLVRNLEIERHIHDCETCAKAHRSLTIMRRSIRQGSLYYKAPAGLEARIQSGLTHARPEHARPEHARAATQFATESRRPPAWRWMALAAALAIAATLAWALLHDAQTSPDRTLAQAVVASHVRSLMATHLYDVESTDQHTVKPWFDGKIDFAPDVRDFKSENFPLQGGRLDYLTNRPVAALVYRHDKHYINLFIWPAPQESDQPESLTTQQGYNLIHWTSGNMTYWAISDTAPETLRKFTALLHTQTPPATFPK